MRRNWLALGCVAAAVAAAIALCLPARKPVGMAAKAPVGALDPRDFGGYFDGQSHPLSARFSSMADACATYPRARALTDEEFPLLLQRVVDDFAMLDSLAGGIPTIELPAGVARWDRPVNLRSKPIRIVGRGSMQTCLRQESRAVPFFLSYPADHPLPNLVDGPDGLKALKLGGTMQDGYYNLSDAHHSDFTSLAGVTFEAWVRLDSLPGGWDLRSVFHCGGSLDGSSATHNDITAAPFFFTVGGAPKVRLFCMQDGTQSYADFPVSVQVGTWTHVAVTIAGAARKLWVGGSLAGTLTVAYPNQTRRPWEDIGVGLRPAGGWPQGWPVEKTIDGAVAGFRVSKKVRYTDTFTPPTGAPVVDNDTLGVLDLNDTDGLLAGARSVYGYAQVLWHQGDYTGDVQGTEISGLRFVGGTFGIFAYGLHNAHLRDLSSFTCRYPVFLTGHSFQNQISDVNFSLPRNGITLTQISNSAIVNAQISYSKAFAVVSKESPVAIYNSWFYGGLGGELLLKDCKVAIADSWTTDEGSGAPLPYVVACVNCPSVDIRNCLSFAATQPTAKILHLQRCAGGTLQNVDFWPHASAERCLNIEAAPKRKYLLQNVAVNGPAVPLTNRPEWVKSLDEAP